MPSTWVECFFAKFGDRPEIRSSTEREDATDNSGFDAKIVTSSPLVLDKLTEM